MDFISLLLLAAGLSMDAFAVAICKGLALKKIALRHALIVGLWFGGFQALMPLIGYYLGAQFKDAIAAYDHWIAFGLLSLIGGNMIREALFEKEEPETDGALSFRSMLLLIGGNMIREALFDQEETGSDAVLSFRAMLPLAVATSIDALAAGITFAALQVNIMEAVCLIGCTTFVISVAGVGIGRLYGNRWQKSADILGGLILIIIAVRILLEHLFG